MKVFPILFVCLLAALAPVAAQTQNAEIRKQVDQAIEDFKNKNYDAVVAFADAAPLDGNDKAFILNLKGAALTKKKDYAGAQAAFSQALEAAPGMFAARFNIHEIDFLQGRYAEAGQGFAEMLQADPTNELLGFKVFLSQLKSGDKEAAQKTLSKIRYPGDTPAWYFAQAAWFLEKGDKGRASDYLAGARYIFSGKTELYEESFTELGWPIK
ncbi:MAG: hypothetical protein Fur0032_18700 [Terrimicrobiaceae bacterium]